MYFLCDRGTARAIKSVIIKPANNTPENSYLLFFGFLIWNNHLSPFSCCLVFRCAHLWLILTSLWCYVTHLNVHLSVLCVLFSSQKQFPRPHSYWESSVTGLNLKKKTKGKLQLFCHRWVADSLQTLINILVINNKGNVFSHHVVQQVLEITAQQKKNLYAIRRLHLWGSVLSLGTNWTIPNCKHTFKKISALQPS